MIPERSNFDFAITVMQLFVTLISLQNEKNQSSYEKSPYIFLISKWPFDKYDIEINGANITKVVSVCVIANKIDAALQSCVRNEQ